MTPRLLLGFSDNRNCVRQLLCSITLLVASCASNQSDSTTSDSLASDSAVPTESNFKIMDDFYTSLAGFQRDTFDIDGYSADGGQLITFHRNDRDYLVWDIWLFGETGRSHSVYWTDKGLNVLIAKCTDLHYDKPYYEKGYKTEEHSAYYSFSSGLITVYDADRRKSDGDNGMDDGRRVRELLANVVREIEIEK